jgi:hypothetical protein
VRSILAFIGVAFLVVMGAIAINKPTATTAPAAAAEVTDDRDIPYPYRDGTPAPASYQSTAQDFRQFQKMCYHLRYERRPKDWDNLDTALDQACYKVGM